ncbi:cytochrome b/b6 domain-containing protein [Psychromonas ossibalaenae]|uniref:cytochrome b/b6 domain-containing protein n=1 Tax=Psychromonas ossibalaenae TaxID=444922 RepID=UPI000378F7D3|nr:cytochrome b/b6 domain-containing protein [Psychromonas ossibalaenae]
MKVWDLPTRLYHWLQALLFAALIISGNQGQGPHVQLGLALFTLLLWRVLWGALGSQTSRFTDFISSPKSLFSYFRGKQGHKAGHNPAGGWMVVLMLLSLLLQCLSGLVLGGFADNLPYVDLWLTDSVFSFVELLHVVLAKLLPILIVVHLLAILFYKLRSKPLVWAMVTGYQKHLSAGSVYFVSNKRALLLLVVSVLVTIAIVVLS